MKVKKGAQKVMCVLAAALWFSGTTGPVQAMGKMPETGQTEAAEWADTMEQSESAEQSETTESEEVELGKGYNPFLFSDTTKEVLEQYRISEPVELVFSEISAVPVTYELTLTRDGEKVPLREKKEFDVEVREGDGMWMIYTYRIFKETFQEDGLYQLNLHSEDTGENEKQEETQKVENRADSEHGKGEVEAADQAYSPVRRLEIVFSLDRSRKEETSIAAESEKNTPMEISAPDSENLQAVPNEKERIAVSGETGTENPAEMIEKKRSVPLWLWLYVILTIAATAAVVAVSFGRTRFGRKRK